MKIASLLSLVVLTLTIPTMAAENETAVQKVFLPPRLHLGNTGISPVQPIDEAAWIWHPEFGNPTAPSHGDAFGGGWRQSVLLRFRKAFDATTAPVRIHVSADERFELFLDGRRIARGPDRSDVEHWSYATYELRLAPGQHRFEALAWSIGPHAPVAQMSWRGGFILKAEADYDRQLTTGKATWDVAKLDGFEFTPGIFFVGAQLTARDCGPQWKEGSYVKAQVVRAALRPTPYGESVAGWKLFPTTLPDQVDRDLAVGRAVALGAGTLAKEDAVLAEQARHPALPKWQALIEGKDQLVVPANTEQFLLWDLGNYYCAYPMCDVSGGAGATLAWSWAESLYQPKCGKQGQPRRVHRQGLPRNDRHLFAGRRRASSI